MAKEIANAWGMLREKASLGLDSRLLLILELLDFV
jgi:hypothetical protein